MNSRAIAILDVGLVTSVGLTTASACAAIRGALTNHSKTRFFDEEGDWIQGAQVPMEDSRGLLRLTSFLRSAVLQCLRGHSKHEEPFPLLLCVAEPERAGRLDGLDELLFQDLAAQIGIDIDSKLSAVLPSGRTGGMRALVQARTLIYERGATRVLVAAADSLLAGPTLAAFDRAGRLLSQANSDGFIPGEAAGAVLLGRPGGEAELVCHGIGFGREPAVLGSEEPLRAAGLTGAINGALVEAGWRPEDVDFRITDVSGEQFYFKEAALAASRVLRVRKEQFDIWHPADCVGEVGAAIGPIMLGTALMACRKSYAPGPNILVHGGTDQGDRGAMLLRYENS